MGSIYDKAAIYDLAHSKKKEEVLRTFYKNLFQDKDIMNVLDVSIGSGNLTLSLIENGLNVSGSDLSSEMLENCRIKAQNKGLEVELKQSDFRLVSNVFDKEYDLVMSTGNSLPYVKVDDVLITLKEMDKLIRPSGYMYIDLRNWDKIVKEKQRFYLYNPFFDNNTRVNVTQVWDHNLDGTITFNILYTFEENNKIFQKEVFEECYNPLIRNDLINMIKSLNYEILETAMFPKLRNMPIEETDWYFIFARKQT